MEAIPVPPKKGANPAQHNTKKPASLPKISQLLKKEPVKVEEKKGGVADISNNASGENKSGEFTAEALKSSWDSYKQSHKDDGNNFELVILNKEFELKNGTEIHIELSGDLELDRLNTLKPSLLGYLRTSLKNDNIDIFAEIKQEVATQKAYTNSDKFKVMMEKNPSLAELKDRLGLDPDI